MNRWLLAIFTLFWIADHSIAQSLLMVLTPIMAANRVQQGNRLWGEYCNDPNFDKKVCSRLGKRLNFDWQIQCPVGVNAEYFTV